MVLLVLLEHSISTSCQEGGLVDGIIDTDTVSKMTGIPTPTLRYWRTRNEGPQSFTLGRRIVYRQSEIERWIAEQEKATKRGGAA